MKTFLKTKLGNIFIIVQDCQGGYLCKYLGEVNKGVTPFFVEDENISVVDTNYNIVLNFEIRAGKTK